MTEQPSKIRSLIERSRGGDQAARDELFQCCRNYVAVVARSQVESWMQTKVDASDLVQQTLLEAHRAFDQFQGTEEAEWLGWLKQILLHNTQDFIRRYRTAKRDAGKEVHIDRPNLDSRGFDLSGSFATASQLLMKNEQQLELANAIMQLSEDHQEVIQLRTLQRLPFDEVAERMGRTRPAVQMLWARALKKLEEVISEGQDRAEGSTP